MADRADSKASGGGDRQARLARQLRANLRKRKQQARAGRTRGADTRGGGRDGGGTQDGTPDDGASA